MGRKSTEWEFTCTIGESENNYTKEYALSIQKKIIQLILDEMELEDAKKRNEENDK